MSKQVLIRLSHLIQNYDWPNNNLEDIIKSVMAITEVPVTQEILLEKITDVLGISVSSGRIKNALQRLRKRDEVVSTPTGLILSTEVVSDVKRKVKMRQQLGCEAIDFWIDSELKELELGSTDKENIARDLEVFLKLFFLKHGAYSLSYLQDFSNVESLEINTIFKEIKWSSEVSEQVGRDKFYTFFRYKDANIQRYLLDLLATSVNYLVNVCDSEVLSKLKDKITGKKLYLDSNVVYRLLDLQGIERAKSVTEAINVCRDFGMDIRVNCMTLKELKRRIRYDSKVLKDYPTPTNLAAVGVKFLSEENFVSTYWRKAREVGISVEDYVSFYSHIEEILYEHNITVEEEELVLPDSFGELCKSLDVRLRKFDGTDEKDDYVKSDLAYEHDAYNLALMQYLRGQKSTFIDLPAWFATTDQTLVRFQKTDHSFKNLPPVAILPSQLLGLLAFTRPASLSYGEAFLSLFSRSFIPAQSIVSNELIQKILGRIAHYNSTPELAEKVLSDELFIRKVSAAETDSERDEIIHDALIEKAGELQAALKGLEQKVKTEERQRKELENTIEQKNINYSKQIAAAQENISDLELRDAQQAKLIKRWSTAAKHTWAAIILVFGISPLIYILFNNSFPTSIFYQVLSLASPLLAIGCSIMILFGKQSLIRLLVIFGLVADFLAFYTSILMLRNM